ncbi:MAG: tyrosine-type recombinase/integrase [Candidatus Rokubacteria bacterium]|nr:tyrosine-type recombinase/integrase [Candidatus Rokubacteria bacterium]
MSPLRQAVDEYLTLRRGLGFSLQRSGALLRSFAAFLEREGAPYITRELALRWAQQPTHAQPAHWASRLSAVRRFAQFWSASDPRTEVPPRGLLPHRWARKPPYIYTDGEIRRLLAVARQLPSATGLRPATYTTLLGLLAVTGLRISEAVALNRDDIDEVDGVLTIRRTKFGKSRLVPVHPSTRRALHRYSRLRDRVYPKPTTTSVFVSERGARLTSWTVRYTFNKLSRQSGLRGLADRRGPRLHDFRHRLAVNTLLRWYRAGVDAERHLLELSTYLGHGHIVDTYWYLSAVPELLRLAAARLEVRGRRS